MNDRRHNLKSDIWRESVSEEVGAELDFHVEMRARELASARGIGIEEARRLAEAHFGDLRSVRAECETIAGERERDMKRTAFLSELRQDTVYALRQIRSTPWFSLLVIGTLALAVGATATIFSAVNAVVLRPLAFDAADRVYYISESYKGQPGDVSAGTYLDLEKQVTQLEHVAAIDWSSIVLDAGDSPEQVLSASVTSQYFDVYGVQPVLGRGFLPEDAQPGAPAVVVLSYETYRNRFASNPAVIGSSVRVDNAPAQVVGVLPEGFDPLLGGEEVWRPLSFPAELVAARGSHYLNVVGLAPPGVSHEALEQQLSQLSAGIRSVYPSDFADRGMMARPIRDVLIGSYDTLLFILFAAVLVVLLIACANVANLLLARGAGRAKEIAVRGALGAGRARILRQLLTENLVLALLMVAGAIVLAVGGIALIRTNAPGNIPRISEIRLDPAVLGFTVLTGVLSSLIFGLAPALRVLRSDMQSTLRSGGRDARGSVRDWLRSLFVGAEVALSVLLLIAAGLLIRTSIKVAAVDYGFRTDGLVMARVTLTENADEGGDGLMRAFQSIVTSVENTPGVSHAAAASLPPLSSGGNQMFLNVEGQPVINETAVVGQMRIITPDYMNAMGIPLLRGRMFDARDVRSGVLVTIVTERLAEQLWPGEDPLGKRFACCEGDAASPVYKTVIGVAPDVRTAGPALDPHPEFYLPVAQTPADMWQWFGRTMTIVATGDGGGGDGSAGALADAIRGGVRAVDPTVPAYDVTTISDALRAATGPARFNTMLMTLLGGIALVLAATGIYGVVSYSVNLRTKEISLRMALGASSASVVALLIHQALVPIAGGLLVGLAAALAATRLLSASLIGVTPTDPVTFAAVIVGLVAIAIAAILIPARRASRVQPVEALQG